jgi:hypothetical protein
MAFWQLIADIFLMPSKEQLLTVVTNTRGTRKQRFYLPFVYASYQSKRCDKID